MFYYIYYAKGKGCHKSNDDIAIIKAWTKKQALKILKKYVNLNNINDYNYQLYRLKIPMSKYHNKKILWVSDY